MKKYLIFICVLFLAPSVWGACGGSTSGSSPDLTAYDHSYDCVNLAVNTDATYGDTVNIPAGNGSVNWGSQLYITKGITLAGPGKDNLTINGTYTGIGGNQDTGMYLIAYVPDATSISNDNTFRLTGLTIDTSTNSSVVMVDNDSTDTVITNIIIDNCHLEEDDKWTIIEIEGMVEGVIYDNVLNGYIMALEHIGAGRNSWEHHGYNPGTSSGLYMEDNTITITGSAPQVFGWAGGSLGVIRYNTINHTHDSSTNTLFDIHGNLDESGNYGGIAAEIYGNSLVKTYKNRLDQYLYHRGGSVLFFYNYSDSTYSGDNPRGAHIKPYEEVNETCHPTTGEYDSGEKSGNRPRAGC
jgi:hypothetical protein